MEPETMKHLHAIGKRDAIAEMFMLIRTQGIEKTLGQLANELLAVDPNHPHAKHYLDSLAER